MDDAFALVARDANGDITQAAVGLAETTALAPREAGMWTKIASHLGGASRLRSHAYAPGPAAAEAVLSPDGRLLHAEKLDERRHEALTAGAERRRFAVANGNDAEKALEVWQGLIAGRWSLVDFVDTDGKRLLLALKNTQPTNRRSDLSLRERRVAALVAMGQRDKEIAYILGLSMGSVSGALRRARTKLGAGSRSDLARLWRSES